MSGEWRFRLVARDGTWVVHTAVKPSEGMEIEFAAQPVVGAGLTPQERVANCLEFGNPLGESAQDHAHGEPQ